MNIFAGKGDLVRYQYQEFGYEHDKALCTKHLQLGEVYTVEKTSVGSDSSHVWLKEFPNIAFNTVNFEDFVVNSAMARKREALWELGFK